jgi:hypothetical protein
VDRAASPWLIKRFIDPEAELLFVPEAEVLEVAERVGAISYDAQGAGQYDHREGKGPFGVLTEAYGLDEEDAALWLLADIVHGAETTDRDRTPQSAGLRAIAEGFDDLDVPDDERLAHAFAIYDALYAWCQRQFKSE